ncbi:MAG: IS200/IS605 family transposase [Pyrinomonadaceae bacterium]
MPFVKVWIHFVWSTKNREPFLNKEIRPQVFRRIRENAQKKGIFLDHINGYVDHVHCLISLGTDQKISDIMRLIKGESSFWINRNKLSNFRFEWQDEHFAVSVGESIVDRVRDYIKNQERHHRRKTLQDEYDEMIEKYGFGRFKD